MARGYSLHIGVNQVDPHHYEGWDGPLVACEYDSNDMKSLAANAGYTTTLLNTENATRKNVIGEIRAAARKMKSTDIFFLSYSGHGGQIADTNDDEPDKEDETWCLYDGQVIDDELYELYASFPTGTRILVLSDSCHSGTVTRATETLRILERANSGISAIPGLSIPSFGFRRATGASADAPAGDLAQPETPRYRYMPRSQSEKVYRQHRSFYDRLQKKTKRPRMKASLQLISGCQDNQFSLDGDFNGLFTATLLDVWGNGSFDGTYESFHREIAQQMPPTQSPNHLHFGPKSDEFTKQYPFQI